MQSETKQSKFKRICVFCGSSQGKKTSYQEAAIELGKELVLLSWQQWHSFLYYLIFFIFYFFLLLLLLFCFPFVLLLYSLLHTLSTSSYVSTTFFFHFLVLWFSFWFGGKKPRENERTSLFPFVDGFRKIVRRRAAVLIVMIE